MEDAKTVITDDVEINGSVKCVGGVRLAGKLNGDLSCAGDVLVEKTSTIKGNLTVNSVIVHGQIKGNIAAKERIELKGNARVAGDIKSKRLVVDDGVSLFGKSEITPSENAGGDMALDLDSAAAGSGAGDDSAKAEDEAAKSGLPHRGIADSRARASQLFARK